MMSEEGWWLCDTRPQHSLMGPSVLRFLSYPPGLTLAALPHHLSALLSRSNERMPQWASSDLYRTRHRAYVWQLQGVRFIQSYKLRVTLLFFFRFATPVADVLLIHGTISHLHIISPLLLNLLASRCQDHCT